MCVHITKTFHLITDAISLDYHDLVNMVVCVRESGTCMIHRCEKCPGTEPLREYPLEFVEGIEAEMITFKQWTTTYSIQI